MHAVTVLVAEASTLHGTGLAREGLWTGKEDVARICVDEGEDRRDFAAMPKGGSDSTAAAVKPGFARTWNGDRTQRSAEALLASPREPVMRLLTVSQGAARFAWKSGQKSSRVNHPSARSNALR